ncbi:MAG: hypothetical protein JO011_17465 [Ktedonobacteraceae bacterium]|nr:hypothetical protein [Ktedonobacteraceae bacterium]
MVIVPLKQDSRVDANEEYEYNISYTVESASAFICIATYTQGGIKQTVALKILREYKDKRYHYDTLEKRLTCQKEAFFKNLKITPGIYEGLGRIVKPTQRELEEKLSKKELQSITLGHIVQDSEEIKRLSEQDGEYALVMSYLPEEQRLDLLLQESSVEQQKELLCLLATRVEQMHKDFQPLTGGVYRGRYKWGSYKQLQKKLNHNLMHFDLIKQEDPEIHRKYYDLKKIVLHFIKQQAIKEAFENRRKSNYVKQCHGDLKTKNIWIETIKQNDGPLQHVRILDAVDFNESYRNIDVLSDLAMLVVDIEAKGKEDLAIHLREKYLSLTGQGEDENARIVLTYYLLEKAIVCAIVCLLYDRDERQLGQRFLELAREHADELEKITPSVAEKNFLPMLTQKKLLLV